ncbi:RWP-RK domain-containing protein [Heterostelium album PN500]|uniref:RWP-RK domain-containing protein n=1 Tax=Heterostelium pallidum (strain ATCC 26659 / Pp 5 / PN500) TaxID=670386 RepID=D3BPS9_HETP5|nr:RWP-RK domain-containing protein [Heterostelium album PN500]EFA76212.1 RWP-RK domain-containing protein [Heterostelium album PN500]|eukprot:XP_020428345.1 RWP-RK domain-containing protein [Heterostelium album PN500]
MPLSQEIDLQFLSKYFHLPINDVAKEIGVCATVLKKICRKNGIPRWPHRKIKSIDKMISNLENSTPKNSDEENRIKEEINSLKKKKAYLIKHPNILAIKSSIKQKEAELLNQKINENQFELESISSPMITQPIVTPNFSFLAAAATAASQQHHQQPVQIIQHHHHQQPSISISTVPSTSPVFESVRVSPSHHHHHLQQQQIPQSLSASSSPLSVSNEIMAPFCFSPVPSQSNSLNSSNSDLWKNHVESSPLQTLQNAAADLTRRSSSPSPLSQSNNNEASFIQLPKLNIPEFESMGNTLKTLEPVVWNALKDSNGADRLSPLQTSSSSLFSSAGGQQVVPLPSWFKAEHDSIFNNNSNNNTISQFNNSGEFTFSKSLPLPSPSSSHFNSGKGSHSPLAKRGEIRSVTRVDQLITEEDIHVPYGSPSSPINEYEY